MWRWVVGLAVAVGCGQKLSNEEREALKDLVEARQEAKAAVSSLAKANDLMAEVMAWHESIPNVKPEELRVGLMFAMGPLQEEYDKRKKMDGYLKAAEWYHGEVVGVAPEKIIAKWAPGELPKQ